MAPAARGPHRWTTPLGALFLLLSVSRLAGAHVDYVAPEAAARDPVEFFAELLADPVNLALLAGGALTMGLVGVAWQRWGRHTVDARALGQRLADYRPFVPWMLRLSLGLPLVGAGFSGFLFTPLVETSLRIPLVLVGFLLLLGLATRTAAVAGLLGWLAALAVHGSDLLLAGEYVGGFAAIAILGPGQPSVDDMLASVAKNPRTLYHRLDPVHRWADRLQARLDPLAAYVPTIVRVGLGLTLVYLGASEKLVDPGPGLALAEELGLPQFVPIDAGMWVLGAGLVEVLVGVLLVVGFLPRATSATAFAVLTVTLFALSNDPVLPHVTLFGLSSVVFTLGAGPASVDV